MSIKFIYGISQLSKILCIEMPSSLVSLKTHKIQLFFLFSSRSSSCLNVKEKTEAAT